MLPWTEHLAPTSCWIHSNTWILNIFDSKLPLCGYLTYNVDVLVTDLQETLQLLQIIERQRLSSTACIGPYLE